MDDPTLKGLLTSWSWRPEVLLVVVGLGALYTLGWRRVRKAGHPRITPWWRLLCYLSGLAALVLALVSPVDELAPVLFSAHMLQHLLLMMVAAPLVLLANPLPVCLWGLPRKERKMIGHLLTRKAAVRRVLWAVTLVPVAWLLYVVNLWLWHLPVAYQAALRDPLIHDLEHLAFFGTALLFWWPIIEPAPRLHERLGIGFAILYLLAATGQNTLLGALIAIPERVLYPFYATPTRPFGLSLLDDQALAGSLMWTSGHMYLVPILLMVARALDHEQRETRRREAIGAGARMRDR